MPASVPVAISVVAAAFMWSGGPDIPDVNYNWQINNVSTSDYKPQPITALPLFQSRNSCDVNRLALPPSTDPGTYTVCLPIKKGS